MSEKKKIKIPIQVIKALGSDVREPQLAELVAHFYQCAGGPKKMAELLWTEFMRAREGSLIRQRILDAILRSTKYVNDRTSPTDDMGLLTDADLKREVREALDDIDGPKRTEEAREDKPGGPAE